MSLQQIDEVRRLEQEGGLEPWLPEDYHIILQEPNLWLALTASIAEEGSPEKIIGTGLARFLTTEMELCKIVTAVGFRRMGVAVQLLHRLLDEGRHRQCRACFLEVRPSNLNAIRFYEANGFRSVGMRPCYYANPEENALIMACEL